MIYLANEKYNTEISQGYSFGDPTIYVNLVPDNVPTLITFSVGTEFESTYEVTGKTLSSLTGVSYVRGYAGNYDALTPITCLNNEEFINQFTQAVTSPETIGDIIFGIDGGSTDAYAISLNKPPESYFMGLTVYFKANTANTGACTLNINSLGAKSIKVKGSDPENNTIIIGQIVPVVYDGTYFQIIGGAGGLPNGGTTNQVLRKKSDTDKDTEWHTPAKADVGLGSVDNTADTAKPVSTAQQTALNTKAALTIDIGDNTDLNTIVTSGFYRLQLNNANAPAAGANWSQMIVCRGQDTVMQIIVKYSDASLFVRGGIVGTSWTAWRTL